MKYLIMIMLLVSGCTSSINNDVVEASIKMCSDNGGLSHIRGFSMETSKSGTAHCKNGATFGNVIEKAQRSSNES